MFDDWISTGDGMVFLLVLGREWSFILRGTDSDHTYQFVVHEGRCTCELTRVYLPKVRHRQTFEAANFCTPLGQGGSTLSAQMSVYGALLVGKMPPGGMVNLHHFCRWQNSCNLVAKVGVPPCGIFHKKSAP